PVKPTKPVEPTKLTISTSLHKSSDKITQLTHQSYQNSKVSRQNTNNVSVQKKKILPQTGTKTTDIGILGLAFATAASLLGLISDKVNRKKHN
ncbi:MAG: LPXTG cell wall anchor domain-containing protein, partial [Lactobacillus johnsonii]|nr:LPXTG cell wall anchor domain-containing protein [Lactobacillus johnsonii]